VAIGGPTRREGGAAITHHPAIDYFVRAAHAWIAAGCRSR
jgi:hypothetical protein